MTGSACETVTSLPFGDAQTTSGTCGDPSNVHFTGKERDSESGLDNFGARYDSSQYGRFMTPDWSGTPNPVPYASLAYPQSLNLYSYVQNNPLSHTDPNGYCDVDDEHHGGLWCAFHYLGFTQTAKEAAADEAARQKSIAAWNAYRRSEIKAGRPDPDWYYAIFGALAGAMGGASEFLGESEAATTPTEAEPTSSPRTVQNGVPQPNANGEFIVGPNGTAVRIPPGYVAEPAANGNGIVYRPAGSTGNANTIRIMGPDAQGRYPSGYVRIYNSSGQPLNSSTGKPDTQANTHAPL
jgi:RHS repeat-associated protein